MKPKLQILGIFLLVAMTIATVAHWQHRVPAFGLTVLVLLGVMLLVVVCAIAYRAMAPTTASTSTRTASC